MRTEKRNEKILFKKTFEKKKNNNKRKKKTLKEKKKYLKAKAERYLKAVT